MRSRAWEWLARDAASGGAVSDRRRQQRAARALWLTAAAAGDRATTWRGALGVRLSISEPSSATFSPARPHARATAKSIPRPARAHHTTHAITMLALTTAPVRARDDDDDDDDDAPASRDYDREENVHHLNARAPPPSPSDADRRSSSAAASEGEDAAPDSRAYREAKEPELGGIIGKVVRQPPGRSQGVRARVLRRATGVQDALGGVATAARRRERVGGVTESAVRGDDFEVVDGPSFGIGTLVGRPRRGGDVGGGRTSRCRSFRRGAWWRGREGRARMPAFDSEIGNASKPDAAPRGGGRGGARGRGGRSRSWRRPRWRWTRTEPSAEPRGSAEARDRGEEVVRNIMYKTRLELGLIRSAVSSPAPVISSASTTPCPRAPAAVPTAAAIVVSPAAAVPPPSSIRAAAVSAAAASSVSAAAAASVSAAAVVVLLLARRRDAHLQLLSLELVPVVKSRRGLRGHGIVVRDQRLVLRVRPLSSL